MKNRKILLSLLVLIGISVGLNAFFPFDTPGVQASVSVKPEVFFSIGSFEVTNSLFTTWIVMILITIFFWLATRNLKLIPSGLQNLAEIAIEQLMGLAESVAGPERAKKFFPLASAIFIFVLFGNLLALIPGFGPIGFIHLKPGEKAPVGVQVFGELPAWVGATAEPEHPSGEGVPVLAPFVRAPASDINFPLALALISVFVTQVYGFQALGVFGYLSKFFNFGRVVRGPGRLMGLVDVFVGLLELISEFGKILAFTFRLFGNIFAGEVLLLIMSYLAARVYFIGLPLPFYALELFVAAVQAFVFCVLTLAFMTLATTGHGGEAHATAEHH
jgi:F-type H+-transporting ATPase subunit a